VTPVVQCEDTKNNKDEDEDDDDDDDDEGKNIAQSNTIHAKRGVKLNLQGSQMSLLYQPLLMKTVN
jgi:hypothetical protein